MGTRIAACGILLISVCVFPVWVTILLALGSLVLFDHFYELVPLFFLHDALYSTGLERYFSFPFCMTVLAVVLVYLSVFLRKHMFESVRISSRF